MRALGHALDAVVGLILIVIVAVTLAQVVARYFLGDSLAWSGELSQLLYVFMIALAAAKAGHMRITMVVDTLPAALRRLAEALSVVVSLACLWLLVDGSLELYELTRFDRFTSVPLSQSLFFAAIIAGAALWALFIITAPFADRDKRGPDALREP